MTAKEELREFLKNCTDADLAKLNYPITGIECAKMIVAAAFGSGRTEVHRHKDGRVTIKKIMIQKRKPRRKRRSNHGMRRALIRQRSSR